MRRHLLWVAGLLVASVVPMTAQAATYFGFSIGNTNGPPPVYYYHREPAVYLVPSTGVYVVEDGYGDCDLFRYGMLWYVYDDGYWYRGHSYRGPFRAVDVRYVPTQIFYVPSNHWRHYPRWLARNPRWRYRNDRGNWTASGYGRSWDDRGSWDRRTDDQWRHDNVRGKHDGRRYKDESDNEGNGRGHGRGRQD